MSLNQPGLLKNYMDRYITLPTKFHLFKAMVFPVVMYGCESWSIKKAERQRTDAFALPAFPALPRPPGRAQWALMGRHVVFLTRYDGELRGPLVQHQGSQVSMPVVRGSG